MKNYSNSLEVKTVGGIGNQLFCYFAGLHLAKKLKLDLSVDVTDLYKVGAKHKGTLELLNLEGTFVQRNRQQLIGSRLAYSLITVLSKPKTFRSKVVGYNDAIFSDDKIRRIEGYFQTYIHYFSLVNELQSIKIISPSKWYLEQFDKIATENPIVLHVRRGDYVNLSDLYGLLNSDYYIRAIKELSLNGLERPIWVFSDDIKEARKLLENSVPRFTNWVMPPINSAPIESMMLMSHASANVIANSTFSWWGAALNNSNKPVIAPQKWFKGMPDPEFLYPPNWIQIKSSWIKEKV